MESGFRLFKRHTISTCGDTPLRFNIMRTASNIRLLRLFGDFHIIAVKPLPFSVQTSLVTSLTESTPIICYTDTGNICCNDCCWYRHNSCPHISLGYKLNWLLHLFKVYQGDHVSLPHLFIGRSYFTMPFNK